MKSILFVFEDEKDEARRRRNDIAVHHAMARVIDATGDFISEHVASETTTPKRRRTTMTTTTRTKAAPMVPNLIQGWVDNEHLASIVRPTPLLLCILCRLQTLSTFAVLFLYGWRPLRAGHSRSGLEC